MPSAIFLTKVGALEICQNEKTIPVLLALASIVFLKSAMLVTLGIGMSCLFAGGLICVAVLVGATGPFVNGFTENKQTRLERLCYPLLM